MFRCEAILRRLSFSGQLEASMGFLQENKYTELRRPLQVLKQNNKQKPTRHNICTSFKIEMSFLLSHIYKCVFFFSKELIPVKEKKKKKHLQKVHQAGEGSSYSIIHGHESSHPFSATNNYIESLKTFDRVTLYCKIRYSVFQLF